MLAKSYGKTNIKIFLLKNRSGEKYMGAIIKGAKPILSELQGAKSKNQGKSIPWVWFQYL